MIGDQKKILYVIGILVLVIIVPLGILSIMKYDKDNKKTKSSSNASYNPSPSVGTAEPTAGPSMGPLKSTTFTPIGFSTALTPVKINYKPKPVYSNLKYCGKINKSKYIKEIKEKLKCVISTGEEDHSSTRDNIYHKIRVEVLEKIQTQSYVSPLLDGTSGYIALFATLYPFLKDKNHEVSKAFFDPTGYDTIQELPKPLNMETISELFTELKDNMEVHKDLYKYVEYNKVNIVLAFRYLAIKRVWNDETFKMRLMKNKVKSNSEICESSDSSLSNRVDLFHNVFVPKFLNPRNLNNVKLCMNNIDLGILSYALKVIIVVIEIEPYIKNDNVVCVNNSYTVKARVLGVNRNNLNEFKQLKDDSLMTDLTVVCLINDSIGHSHFLGVI